jgi:hypothetical protein
MRSENVFSAAKKISNRFLLCRVASVSAHRLQRSPKPFVESINKSLKLIADMSPTGERDAATGEFQISCDHMFLSAVIAKPLPLSTEQTFEPLLDVVIGAG